MSCGPSVTSAPVSVALGDLPDLPHTAALAARGAALSGAAFVKVGLRGVRDLERAVAVMSAVADAVEVDGDGVSVIAAAYADAGALDPPALAPAHLPLLVERTGSRERWSTPSSRTAAACTAGCQSPSWPT